MIWTKKILFWNNISHQFLFWRCGFSSATALPPFFFSVRLLHILVFYYNILTICLLHSKQRTKKKCIVGKTFKFPRDIRNIRIRRVAFEYVSSARSSLDVMELFLNWKCLSSLHMNNMKYVSPVECSMQLNWELFIYALFMCIDIIDVCTQTLTPNWETMPAR